MARTTEEIEAEIASTEAELRRLERLPSAFQIHGQSVDNTDRIGTLRRRLRELEAERDGRSGFQGPDLEV